MRGSSRGPGFAGFYTRRGKGKGWLGKTTKSSLYPWLISREKIKPERQWEVDERIKRRESRNIAEGIDRHMCGRRGSC